MQMNVSFCRRGIGSGPNFLTTRSCLRYGGMFTVVTMAGGTLFFQSAQVFVKVDSAAGAGLGGKVLCAAIHGLA